MQLRQSVLVHCDILGCCANYLYGGCTFVRCRILAKRVCVVLTLLTFLTRARLSRAS